MGGLLYQNWSTHWNRRSAAMSVHLAGLVVGVKAAFWSKVISANLAWAPVAVMVSRMTRRATPMRLSRIVP